MIAISAFATARSDAQLGATTARPATALVERPPADGESSGTHVARLRTELLDADSSRVFIVAHRGDWRNAPENSLQAIQNCIDMGVDIVEVDVRMTRDRRLVLLHDDTLDRTTTGTGPIWDRTLGELSKLHLKNGQGIPTRHRIPTLEEAMRLARGRILVNLDKCYDLYREVYTVLDRTGTLDHAIIKGWQTPPGDFGKRYGAMADEVLFMPIIDLDQPAGTQLLASWRAHPTAPFAYEFIFAEEPPEVAALCRELHGEGSRVWFNALWPFFNAGHDDDRAVGDPEGSYGWLVSAGASIIQTDRPRLLRDYLQAE